MLRACVYSPASYVTRALSSAARETQFDEGLRDDRDTARHSRLSHPGTVNKIRELPDNVLNREPLIPSKHWKFHSVMYGRSSRTICSRSSSSDRPPSAAQKVVERGLSLSLDNCWLAESTRDLSFATFWAEDSCRTEGRGLIADSLRKMLLFNTVKLQIFVQNDFSLSEASQGSSNTPLAALRNDSWTRYPILLWLTGL